VYRFLVVAISHSERWMKLQQGAKSVEGVKDTLNTREEMPAQYIQMESKNSSG
jgi:hypothetical protein